MKYLYTADGCSKCVIRKKELDEAGVEYEVRDASRLEGGLPSSEIDAIDRSAHIELNMNNMQLPVEIDSD